jgi:CheY-like chemotaxis protein
MQTQPADWHALAWTTSVAPLPWWRNCSAGCHGSIAGLAAVGISLFVDICCNAYHSMLAARITSGQQGLKMATIALVKDDRKTLSAVSEKLKAEGHNIQVYQGGVSALTGLKNEVFDLVVVDIAMPSVDGAEILRRLRQESSTPMIFLTGHAGAEPFSDRQLIECIDAALDRPAPDRDAAAKESGTSQRGNPQSAASSSLRYLSAQEQRVFNAALRRSVKVISRGK